MNEEKLKALLAEKKENTERKLNHEQRSRWEWNGEERNFTSKPILPSQ